jgi:uncharacterized membrane protein YqjE
MHHAPASERNLKAASKQFGRRLLTLLENRLELLTVEVQEERERLLHDLLLALGVAAFGLLAGLSFTAALVVLFWKYSPLTVLLVMTALYTAAGLALCRLLVRRLREWQSFSASLDQLRKDRQCLDQILS